ncbi:MAG: hypothetical protein PWQ12_1564, partial [Clostridiales bacterium]|nr:hypothetical protein [Clostridiales bacterium]
VPIHIPALRSHKSDIPDLVKHLIIKYNQEYGRNVSSITPEALSRIMAYDWPGNVRELENYVGRAMINIKMTENALTEKHLPIITADIEAVGISVQKQFMENELTLLDDALSYYERLHIERVLRENQMNREKTALALGVSLRTLYYKLKKLNIQF